MCELYRYFTLIQQKSTKNKLSLIGFSSRSEKGTKHLGYGHNFDVGFVELRLVELGLLELDI